MKQNNRLKSDQSIKIPFDKYITPAALAKECVSILFHSIPVDESFTFIDPCAGDGSFSRFIENCLAFDICPDAEGIIKADFLSIDIKYLSNRVVFGNPPYGSRLNSAVKFFKKSVEISDFVAFLLPLSQLDNNTMFYEFDLIKSAKMGKHVFSGRYIDCVFNIYKRPESGELNQKPENKQYRQKFSDVNIYEVRNKNKVISDYDIRICAWGSVGKPILEGENYAKELYLKINRLDIKDNVLSLIKNADWRQIYSMKGVCNLAQWQVIKYLKDNIADFS
jgi:predicted RNA methylase